MPAFDVVSYQEKPGTLLVTGRLRNLNVTNPKAFEKCRAAISRLALLGYQPSRIDAYYLRDEFYEVSIRLGSFNYCLMYFLHGRTVSVVAHCLAKESAVTAIDIKLAIAHKAAFTATPATHTFKVEFSDA